MLTAGLRPTPTRPLSFTALFALMFSTAAFAAPISISSGETLVVEWSINSPTPVNIGAVELILGSGSGSAADYSSALYNGSTLLGSGTSTNSLPLFNFARSGSNWAGVQNAVVVDFASIDDGSILGIITLSVPVGTLLLDNTDQIAVHLNKEVGGFVVGGTSVNRISVIPEPSTALLMSLGLVGLGAAGKRK